MSIGKMRDNQVNKYYGLKPGTITSQELEHTKIVREVAARGMVLMENDGTLPLEKGAKIALYGSGAKNTEFSGLGAASFVSREEVSILDGLERAGLIVTSKEYLERYAEMIQKQEDAYYGRLRGFLKESLITAVVEMYGDPLALGAQPIVSREDLEKTKEAEIAVYVISRTAGEGADRRLTEGDYYLSKEEKENLRILSENFNKLIVLLNIGSQIDTTYIRNLPNLSAMVFVGQAAGVTGLAVADVLTGKITPEGKFVDTWAEKYEDYPNALNYGAMNGNLNDEYYTEGIYVGYRYFDSFGIKPAYPFGYGLSYTDFEIKTENIFKENGNLIVQAQVKNIGSCYAGREVVQVYVSAPNGELEKPYQELKGFQKTRLLKPGEAQNVEIEIELKSLASYNERKAAWVLEAGDYLIRVGNSSRNTFVAAVVQVKEEIIYEQCRNLCRDENELQEMSTETVKSILKVKYNKENEIIDNVDENLEESENTVSHNAAKNSNESTQLENVAEANASQVIEVSAQDIVYTCNTYRTPLWENDKSEGNQNSFSYKSEPTKNEDSPGVLQFQDIVTGHLSLDDFVNSLTAQEMCCLCVGNAGDEEATFVSYGSKNTKTDAVIPMAPGTCDTTRTMIESRGISNMHMSDGGGGLRVLPQFEVDKEGNLLTEGVISVRNVDKIIGGDYIQDRVNHDVYEQYMTGLPIATMLAQTWDRDCWQKCGEIEGKEMQMTHVELWLAPSMNIHRNPLCGRNFEYYSEDPVITGECGAAVTRAIQKFRYVGVTIKHFACNNQEDNRHATNAHVSERALREIYLKGYEIAVKTAHPAAMMTAYNLINGTHSANHYELLTSILRDEWGFDGMVMTDWGTTSFGDDDKRKYKASTCWGCIRAGNDLIMPGAKADIDSLYHSVQIGEISLEELRICSKRILRTMLRLEAGRI